MARMPACGSPSAFEASSAGLFSAILFLPTSPSSEGLRQLILALCAGVSDVPGTGIESSKRVAEDGCPRQPAYLAATQLDLHPAAATAAQPCLHSAVERHFIRGWIRFAIAAA